MTCNMGEEREAKKWGRKTASVWARRGKPHKYERMWCEQKRTDNEDRKREVEERRKSGWVWMSAIKITMERCRKVSQTTSSPLLRFPLSVAGPKAHAGCWTPCAPIRPSELHRTLRPASLWQREIQLDLYHTRKREVSYSQTPITSLCCKWKKRVSKKLKRSVNCL